MSTLGRFALRAGAAALLFAGVFAIFLGVRGQFLPHDERFLGMTAKELCALHGCRIVHFMIHDRISFGGALFSIGLLYLWLIEGPLREGRTWAWWCLLLSATEGFASFFAYIGYGYFDTWHGIGTLALLPCFVVGLVQPPLERVNSISTSQRAWAWPGNGAGWFGRLYLGGTSLGLIFAGLTILLIGTSSVFVPQDLTYMDVSVDELNAVNPRLIPLIAHDRAGFGGAVCCCGIILSFCIWRGTPSTGLWWVLATVGIVGFGTAIGVHPAVGYNDPVHLAPAVIGAVFYTAGLVLTFGIKPSSSPARLCCPCTET
jgi:hypothetical protein